MIMTNLSLGFLRTSNDPKGSAEYNFGISILWYHSKTGYNTSILLCALILSPFPICIVMPKIEGREENLIF
jgi:hypothetical protein